MTYGYDDASRRTSITYPGGSNQVAYAYDAANRLTTVTDWNSKATSYAYDDAGRMTTTTLPASTGVVSSYTYDNANRLTAISHVKGGVTLASASYTLDNAGNRTQKVDLNGTESYSYDNAYRLTSVTYPGPSTTSYTYDAFGNRSTKVDAGGTTNYAYNDDSRLTSVTPPNPAPVVNYTWDNNGNVTARGSDSFAWDFEDRMTSATVGGTTTTFAYRGDGLRNSRTTGGVTTTFTWDIASGLPVVIDDGSQYVYGAGLVSQVAGANTYYYLSDGSVRRSRRSITPALSLMLTPTMCAGRRLRRPARRATTSSSRGSRRMERGCSICGPGTTTRRRAASWGASRWLCCQVGGPVPMPTPSVAPRRSRIPTALSPSLRTPAAITPTTIRIRFRAAPIAACPLVSSRTRTRATPISSGNISSTPSQAVKWTTPFALRRSGHRRRRC